MISSNALNVGVEIDKSVKGLYRYEQKRRKVMMNRAITYAKVNILRSRLRFKGKLFSAVKKRPNSVFIDGRIAPYAAYQEFGTKGYASNPVSGSSIAKDVSKIMSKVSGKGSNSRRSGFKDLRKYVKSKGYSSSDLPIATQVFFLIRHLTKKGNKPSPFFFPAILKAWNRYKKELEAYAVRNR